VTRVLSATANMDFTPLFQIPPEWLNGVSPDWLGAPAGLILFYANTGFAAQQSSCQTHLSEQVSKSRRTLGKKGGGGV